MADRATKVSVDPVGSVFLIGCFALVILFWGEPDLHDGLVARLMGSEPTTLELNASKTPETIQVPGGTEVP